MFTEDNFSFTLPACGSNLFYVFPYFEDSSKSTINKATETPNDETVGEKEKNF